MQWGPQDTLPLVSPHQKHKIGLILGPKHPKPHFSAQITGAWLGESIAMTPSLQTGHFEGYLWRMGQNLPGETGMEPIPGAVSWMRSRGKLGPISWERLSPVGGLMS